MEPVRRRVVGESAGKILSMENPVDPELLKKLFADLENINEDVRLFSVKYSALIKGGDPALATVLRCHLVAEHFLSEYLAAANPAVVDWDGARLTFAQKLALAENAMSAVAFITPGLACLNRARNRFSHRLDVVLDSTDLGPIEEIMRISEGEFRRILTDERIHKDRVRVTFIGRVKLLPENLQQLMMNVERATQNYNDHFLNIAFAYGGRAEIVDAAKKIAEEVQKGELSPEKVDEQMFEQYLYTSHLPKQDPDLIIRTSGEERLSGFLLWQSAYSELFFLDVYWPDFRLIDLLRAVRTFKKRKRRFGA